MSKGFDDLAKSVKAGWPDDVHRVYEAAASEFAAEVAERVELGAQLAAAREAQALTQPALSALTGIQLLPTKRCDMRITNITEAKATLSKLIERAQQGEEIVIGKAGKPVAKLVPFDLSTVPRDLDQVAWEGKVRLSEDLDELPEDWLDAFYGRETSPEPTP